MDLVELGTILHMEKGKKPKAQSKEAADGYLPYVDIKAFEQGIIDNYATTEKSLLCDDGDLLIVCDGSRSGLTGRAIRGVVGSTLSKIYADGLTTEYLRYFIQSKYMLLNTQKRGTGTPHLNANILKASKLVVPSIPEQERIVARIEELFSELDKAVETLQKTKQQLAVYRQAVLKEAFSGISSTVSMDRIATMIDPQPSHRTPPECTSGIPYIGIGDIDYNIKKIEFTEARKVSPDVLSEHLERYTIHNGDFIMGKIGTIGKPFKIPLPQNYTLSANVILIQPDVDKINPDFLFWQFSSPVVTQQLNEGANATSQPAFGIKKARLLSICVCDKHQQDAIVNDIEEKISVCDSIEQTVNTALAQAEAMRQSILKKAFEGRLL